MALYSAADDDTDDADDSLITPREVPLPTDFLMELVDSGKKLGKAAEAMEKALGAIELPPKES